MTEGTVSKKRLKENEGESVDPVRVVRQGAIAASIWKRQSPSGYAYYDFTLSRSWKSLGTAKSGYSKSFFGSNEKDLVEVIGRAAAWIAEQPQGAANGEMNPESQAA